jgi:cell division protein WhiA
VTLVTGRAAVARAMIAAAHEAGHEAHAYRSSPTARSGRWIVALSVEARLDLARLSTRLLKRACCTRAVLRAAFLTCGSVSDPARGYHLEFSCKNDAVARLVCGAVARFGGDAGVTRRRGRPLVYVKDAQTISTLLANMGAARAVLKLEEHRALQYTKNMTHRTVNSEAANAARTAASAARQRNAAQRVLAAPGVRLSHAVREAARLRLAYPARSLGELARLSRPPITKAAMANRMRLLERLAER